jgi:uncharacterized phage protein (TIGR01671 family)
MQQYLFRGKRVDNGEWVTGWFYFFEGAFIRHCHETYHIDEGRQNSFTDYEDVPETVGMWTGLKDKNNIDIYQGDIYLAERGYMPSRGYKKKGYPDRITVICVVEWSVYDAGWFGREVSPIKDHVEFSKNAPYDYLFTSLHGSSNGNAEWIELISNIHDNPELIKPALKEGII